MCQRDSGFSCCVLPAVELSRLVSIRGFGWRQQESQYLQYLAVLRRSASRPEPAQRPPCGSEVGRFVPCHLARSELWCRWLPHQDFGINAASLDVSRGHSWGWVDCLGTGDCNFLLEFAVNYLNIPGS